jgi:hypothetical protein
VGSTGEVNPHQLGHRAYVAVDGGERDCPYPYLHDLVAGSYRVPCEEPRGSSVRACGYWPFSTLERRIVLLIVAIILLIIAIAGGVIVHPLVFALAIVALVLFFMGR